jgi:NADPH:quinone reductase-like Zn-dependent oxidoreductase
VLCHSSVYGFAACFYILTAAAEVARELEALIPEIKSEYHRVRRANPRLDPPDSLRLPGLSWLSEGKLAHKPANLTFEQAAVVAIMGSTALQALRDHGKVRPGQEVLIIGASGGVGTYAVQIAKAFGAHVTGVCSTQKVQMVRSIGADHVIDYTQEDFAEGDQRYDVILDIGGNSTLSHLRRALASRGTLVIVGGEGGGRWLGGTDRQLRAMMISPFVGQKLGTFVNKENHEDMLVLKELVESGEVTPIIDRTYPLAEVPEAIRYLEEGHARGKVVISV